MLDKIYTAIGSPNIAFVKYWGTRNEKINLPFNSSLSMTLDKGVISTKTSIVFSKKFDKDKIIVDGNELNLEEPKNKGRFDIIEEARKKANIDAKALVVSHNNFPKGSGLASSASAGATLAFLLNKALELNMNERELSIMARKFSGSACRGIYGGIVLWHRGMSDDGTDSYSEQVLKKEEWSDLIDIIVLISEQEKKVSSKEGHVHTATTSELFRIRPEVAERHVERALDYLKNKDFHNLAEIIMRDSNSMHAVMLDSYPPIFYLNETSKEIIYRINQINEENKENIAAYTFDAGPNANIITLKKYKDEIIEKIRDIQGIKDIIVVEMDQSGPILSNDHLINDY